MKNLLLVLFVLIAACSFAEDRKIITQHPTLQFGVSDVMVSPRGVDPSYIKVDSLILDGQTIVPGDIATTTTLGNYVLKAGDTMTGALVITKSGTDAFLTLRHTSTGSPKLVFQNSTTGSTATDGAYIGMLGSAVLFVNQETGGLAPFWFDSPILMSADTGIYLDSLGGSLIVNDGTDTYFQDQTANGGTSFTLTSVKNPTVIDFEGLGTVLIEKDSDDLKFTDGNSGTYTLSQVAIPATRWKQYTALKCVKTDWTSGIDFTMTSSTDGQVAYFALDSDPLATITNIGIRFTADDDPLDAVIISLLKRSEGFGVNIIGGDDVFTLIEGPETVTAADADVDGSTGTYFTWDIQDELLSESQGYVIKVESNVTSGGPVELYAVGTKITPPAIDASFTHN